MTELVLIGASGLAREALPVCARLGVPVRGVVDDDPARAGTPLGGVRVLGGLDRLGEHPDAQLLLCTGKGASRRALADRLARLGVTEDRYARLIDPSVAVPDGCSVGAGSILLAGTVLTAEVTIGRHVVVMPRCVLTHDVRIDDFATLTAGVSLGGGVRVGEAAYLGMNASVRERVTVGAGAVLGMGAAALGDIAPESTWVGVPARPLGARRPPALPADPPIASAQKELL